MSYFDLFVIYPLVALEWTVIAGLCIGMLKGMLKAKPKRPEPTSETSRDDNKAFLLDKLLCSFHSLDEKGHWFCDNCRTKLTSAKHEMNSDCMIAQAERWADMLRFVGPKP